MSDDKGRRSAALQRLKSQVDEMGSRYIRNCLWHMVLHLHCTTCAHRCMSTHSHHTIRTSMQRAHTAKGFPPAQCTQQRGKRMHCM